MNDHDTNLNLVQKALQSVDLENFVDGLQLTGLSSLMKVKGPFTVFAPINVAFLEIPENVVHLIEAENDLLGSIFKYHVAPGSYHSADLFKTDKLQTLMGEDLYIVKQNGVLWINNAKVVRSDLTANNGVIHVVDRMLLPHGLDSGAAQSQLTHS